MLYEAINNERCQVTDVFCRMCVHRNRLLKYGTQSLITTKTYMHVAVFQGANKLNKHYLRTRLCDWCKLSQ